MLTSGYSSSSSLMNVPYPPTPTTRPSSFSSCSAFCTVICATSYSAAIGGWISGPMLDTPQPAPVVPPGSTAVRELADARRKLAAFPSEAELAAMDHGDVARYALWLRDAAQALSDRVDTALGLS